MKLLIKTIALLVPLITVCGILWADSCTMTLFRTKHLFGDTQTEAQTFNGCDKYEKVMELARNHWKTRSVRNEENA